MSSLGPFLNFCRYTALVAGLAYGSVHAKTVLQLDAKDQERAEAKKRKREKEIQDIVDKYGPKPDSVNFEDEKSVEAYLAKL
eukprot:Clim_evm15s191 gene=Clim_evmTU15s191